VNVMDGVLGVVRAGTSGQGLSLAVSHVQNVVPAGPGPDGLA
jgi:hypothetical protein